jgi:hypothetical protein
MTEREAWMWMIAQAAWSETKHLVGGELVKVGRGCFMVTLREMQSKFMWASDKRVRNYLQKLENHKMIAVLVVGERNARKTHVTVCNYEEYQSKGRTKDAAKTQQGRTGDAVKDKGTIPTLNNTEDKSSLLLPENENDDYQDFLSKHPRSRQSDAGQDAWLAATEDADPKEIISAAARYAVVSKSFDENKVKFSDNWLLAKGWEKYPAPQAVKVSSQADRLAYWATAINGTGFLAASSITPSLAREIIGAGLVTPEQMKSRGIAA